MTAPRTASPAAALVWLALMAATPAGAVPVQHHFTLRRTNGELARQTSSRRFAYDLTLAVPQAWWPAEALQSDTRSGITNDTGCTRLARQLTLPKTPIARASAALWKHGESALSEQHAP